MINIANRYVLISNGSFIIEDGLWHYGVKDMHWGVRRYQNEDGSLTKLGKSRLRGYDGAESDIYSENWRNAEAYSNIWKNKYGSVPINRLRFEYDGSESINRGSRYCSNYDWNKTSLDNIYDSYREYRDSEDWD